MLLSGTPPFTVTSSPCRAMTTRPAPPASHDIGSPTQAGPSSQRFVLGTLFKSARADKFQTIRLVGAAFQMNYDSGAKSAAIVARNANVAVYASPRIPGVQHAKKREQNANRPFHANDAISHPNHHSATLRWTQSSGRCIPMSM
jgi:hypothetical protein